MVRRLCFILIFIFLFPLTAEGLDARLKQKFPYIVLTDDYGILNETDLDSVLDGVKHPPLFSDRRKGSYIYWQCFPVDSVTLSLEDLGSSPEDDPESDVKYNGEHDARLTIRISVGKGVIHKYVMWANFPVSETMSRFKKYQNLMYGEENVCLEGSWLEKEEETIKGEIEDRTWKIYNWGFVKIKTKKGCEAYHRNGCHYDTVQK